MERADAGSNVASTELLHGPNCKEPGVIWSHPHFDGDADGQEGEVVSQGPQQSST